MSIRREQLLATWGLKRDPFERWATEQERALGSGVNGRSFVPPPFFDLVVGDLKNPESRTVVGDRGSGKSRIKDQVASELLEEVPPPLVAQHLAFSNWTEKAVRSADLEVHVSEIIREIIRELLGQVGKEPVRFSEVKEKDWHHMDRLLLACAGVRYDALAARFDDISIRAQSRHGSKSRGRRFWRSVRRYFRSRKRDLLGLGSGESSPGAVAKIAAVLLPAEVDAQEVAALPAIERLSWAAELVVRFGFASTIVMVDRVDEGAALNGAPALSADLVRPLVTNLPLLEIPELGFKFFLPTDVLTALGDSYRPDRIRLEPIRWTQELLLRFLDRRLDAYARGTGLRLADIVRSNDLVSFGKRAYAVAGGFPRDLIRLMNKTVGAATERMSEPGRLELDDLQVGATRFQEIRLSEADGGRYQQRVRAVSEQGNEAE